MIDSMLELRPLVLKTEDLVKIQYRQQYVKLREIYGIKLNYSLQLDRQNQEIKLVKRAKKAWFKTLNAQQQKLALEESKKISEDILDKSYLSLNEDQLNKSALLLDMTQQVFQARMEVVDEEPMESAKDQVSIGLALIKESENPDKLDLTSDEFSRVSSKAQEDIKVEALDLFKQRSLTVASQDLSLFRSDLKSEDKELETRKNQWLQRVEKGLDRLR